jgi:hypothetical protein
MGLISDLTGGTVGQHIGSAIKKKRAKASTSDTVRTSESMDRSPVAEPDSYRRGGKVRKTGYAKVHKGERVLTRKQARRYRGK